MVINVASNTLFWIFFKRWTYLLNKNSFQISLKCVYNILSEIHFEESKCILGFKTFKEHYFLRVSKLSNTR